MDDHSRKAMRQFYCRDYLWELYESMASDFDCSIDFLINEAMRHYARSKNYAPAGDEAASAAPPSAPAPQPAPPPRPANPRATMPPPPPPRRGRPPAGRPTGGAPPPGRPPARPPERPQARPPGVTGPPPQRGAARPPGQPGPRTGGRPQLNLVFQGQRYAIGKDEFVIGRGSKTSDLPIKDGNVSRKHAMVVYRGGAFYLQDCGSTNGIEYNGMRIDNKKIDEGDVFHICDYELRFTYR